MVCFSYNIIIILEKSDVKTLEAIKNFECKIVYQSGKGYGNALIEGIKNVETNYLCIFNADGSFDPKYLNDMLKIAENNTDFVFGSRYMKGAGSEDDTFLTIVGNYFFSIFGKFFFSLKISDILFTYLLGNFGFILITIAALLSTSSSLNANLFSSLNMSMEDIPSFERRRIAGKKKVNEFRDGFKILIFMVKNLFNF